MNIDELARRCHRTPAQVRESLRPLMRDLYEFCTSDGGDEAARRFRESPGGRLLKEALKESRDARQA